MLARSPIAALLASATLLVAAPLLAQEPEEEGPVSGEIRADGARVEVLPGPPRAGERVEVQGGWYRIESGEEEPGPTGSFTVLPRARARAPAPAEAAQVEEAPRRAGAERPRPGGVPRVETGVGVDHPCHPERQRVARELFRIAGIWHFDRPLDWLEALRQDPVLSLSPWVRFNLFGIPSAGPLGVNTWVDPIRAVGWDEGLRWAADDLLDCLDRQR